jgi:hypothetical protein
MHNLSIQIALFKKTVATLKHTLSVQLCLQAFDFVLELLYFTLHVVEVAKFTFIAVGRVHYLIDTHVWHQARLVRLHQQPSLMFTDAEAQLLARLSCFFYHMRHVCGLRSQVPCVVALVRFIGVVGVVV